MKIIHFIPSIDKSSGGTAEYIRSLSMCLGKKVDLLVVTGNHLSNPLELLNWEVKFIDLELSFSPSLIPKTSRLKKQINQILLEFKPDIFHVNGVWMPQLVIAQTEAQKLGIKVVLSPHGMLEPWILNRNVWKKKIAMLLYQNRALKNVDFFHATAQSEKDTIINLGYLKPTTIVANGIDIDSIVFKDNWIKSENILFLSRLHPKKGIENLIDAIVILRNDFNNCKVIIAGEGDIEYISHLKAKVKNSKLTNIIDFRGGVYGDDKWKLFREADVFVLPTYSENFGIVVAESLASGTPVITTIGTPWEELNSKNCGWWIDLGTEPLVKALRDYLSLSSAQMQIKGNNGRELVIDKYSSTKMAQDMFKIYENCL